MRRDVRRGAGGDVLVERRLLLVPRDAEAGALRDREVEVHAQDAGGARGRGLAGLLPRHELLRHDHLHDQDVRHGGAICGLHAADGGVIGLDGEGEFDLDGAVGPAVV